MKNGFGTGVAVISGSSAQGNQTKKRLVEITLDSILNFADSLGLEIINFPEHRGTCIGKHFEDKGLTLIMPTPLDQKGFLTSKDSTFRILLVRTDDFSPIIELKPGQKVTGWEAIYSKKIEGLTEIASTNSNCYICNNFANLKVALSEQMYFWYCINRECRGCTKHTITKELLGLLKKYLAVPR